MSTFGNILSTARMAIYAHQTAIQVASHNIANAETPGYSRQRAQLTEGIPQVMPYGNVGTGVRITDVEQVRDGLLDAGFRRESANAAGFGLRRDLLGQLEGILAEPGERGFAATLDGFWNAWSDLANDPTSSTAREVVRQRGDQVARTLNGFAARLDDLTADTSARLTSSITEINGLSSTVAELNAQIVSAEVGGRTAGDLRDQRNLALDRIAQLAPVQVSLRANGSVSVALNGQNIVDGDSHQSLTSLGGAPNVRLAFVGSAQPLQETGGQLGAMLRVLNEDVPAARARLDELAAGIVDAVNARHAAGWSPAREPVAPPPAVPAAPPGWSGSGVLFFDPARTTAATIGLSADVAASRDNIAAGGVYGGTGDNAVALGLAGLRELAVPVGTPPASLALGTHFRETVVAIGRDVHAATGSAEVFETLAAQTETRRQSVSGVSTDEELITLMRHQQAYIAATRLVTAVDEMAQALLGMV